MYFYLSIAPDVSPFEDFLGKAEQHGNKVVQVVIIER